MTEPELTGENLAALYGSTLEDYVNAGHEYQLEAAYALGRRAFADGITILGLLDLHRRSVEALMQQPWPFSEAERVKETFVFLAEALSTFEMAQRGYWEAQERALLERAQSELRRRLAQAYLTVDRAVDLPERLAAIGATAAKLVDAPGARCYLTDGPVGAEAPPAHVVFDIRDPAGQVVARLDIDLTDRPPLTDNDRFVLDEFSRMAGVAVENARQFARERSIALMLQRDLLPVAMPRVAGLDIAVRYLPGETESHAGGDWYDVFTLDSERVGLVVGDVTGHGVAAAAAMGRLRIAVLAYALAGNDAAEVVTRVDALLNQLGTGEIATMVYVVAHPATGELTLVNAGHPPPVVIRPDGSAQPLTGGHGRLLGVSLAPQGREHALATLEPSSHLLLYTDGLIEPSERTERDGVAHLCDVAKGFVGTAEELCDHVLAELTPAGSHDDICIVVATRSSETTAIPV